jgi:acetate kinase
MSRILVLNAGSSSLKASVIDIGSGDAAASTSVAWGSDATRVEDRRATVAAALDELWQAGADRTSLTAAGHRVVHGGARFVQPTLVDEGVLAGLAELEDLAPLHNAVALDTISAQRALLPELPAVAVFDTAFHASLAEEAFVYPLPWRWYEEWGIRRFGFHGLSVAWSVRRAAEILGRPPTELRLVVAHLGSGCSVTAVSGGRSVSTSMGLTPLEGLTMGTRSGSVDPGILLHVLRERGVSPDELADVLDHQSGLLGISGISGDMRELAEAADRGSRRARLAIDIFVRRAAAGIAVAAAALPRLDALVFTGGIGEHDAAVRAAITARLATLGIPAVPAEEVADDALLSPPDAGIAVLRVAAREDLVIAEAVAALDLPR